MVAVHLVTASTQKEAAKQTLLKQLREAGATMPQMPGSLEAESDDAKAALADLLAAGIVREARPGLYYLGPTQAKESRPGIGFVVLLTILVVISFLVSAAALLASLR